MGGSPLTQSAILCHQVTVGTEEDEWEESVGRGRVPPSQESVELMTGFRCWGVGQPSRWLHSTTSPLEVDSGPFKSATLLLDHNISRLAIYHIK